jgi:hypothetical protein
LDNDRSITPALSRSALSSCPGHPKTTNTVLVSKVPRRLLVGVEGKSDEQEHRGERQRMWQSDCGAFLSVKK